MNQHGEKYIIDRTSHLFSEHIATQWRTVVTFATKEKLARYCARMSQKILTVYECVCNLASKSIIYTLAISISTTLCRTLNPQQKSMRHTAQ